MSASYAVDPTVWHYFIVRAALRLELKGFKHSRGSVYALVKREFGFKGNKQRVYDQLDAWINERYPVKDAP